MAKKESKFFSEFRKFIMRGNVVDMAVGIVVGGAFTAIVNSLVQDIINPFIGLLIKKIDFKELKIVLQEATETTGEVAIRYGILLQTIVQFLLTSLVLFIVIKAVNRMKEAALAAEEESAAEAEEAEKKAQEEKEAKEKAEQAAKDAESVIVSEEVLLLRDIKELLKKN